MASVSKKILSCTLILIALSGTELLAFESNSSPSLQIQISDTGQNGISILELFPELGILVKSKIYSLLDWKIIQPAEQTTAEPYDRVHHFGHWVNDPTDSTCYNTRTKVLIRDSVKAVVFEKQNPCNVLSGKWEDPYAKKVLRDPKLEVQIDHMVPLKNAYISGAYKWDFKTRCLYGNYLGAKFHLISVDGSENMRKGSGGPDKYMPPNTAYRCTYLKNWLLIKALWKLELSLDEAQAIKELMKSEGCRASSFHITELEIERQQKFMAQHAELCENIIPSDSVH